MSLKVAFLGLGVMGYPMAGHLKKSGLEVTVYNRTRAKAERWVEEYGGQFKSTPAEAVTDAAIVFACVGNDSDVRSVVYGRQGAFCSMSASAIFVDHSTTSAELARELSDAAHQQELKFVDAPVSGGQVGAENGMLTIMCGGDQQAFTAIQPVINNYAKASVLMGQAGSGQLAKMVNQICIAGLVQGLSEGVHFAQQSGLDCDLLFPLIAQGAAGSWQMENRYSSMTKSEYNHGFAVDWMRKDLGIVLDEARNNCAHLPVTALVDQFYSDVQAMGGNRWDTSSLLARLTNPKILAKDGNGN